MLTELKAMAENIRLYIKPLEKMLQSGGGKKNPVSQRFMLTQKLCTTPEDYFGEKWRQCEDGIMLGDEYGHHHDSI